MSNWYLKLVFAQGLQGFLSNIDASTEVQQFILSLPDQQKQYYVSVLRQNPQISLSELQAVGVPVQNNTELHMPHEQQLVARFPINTQKWLLYSLKQARQGNLDLTSKQLTDVGILVDHPEMEEYSNVHRTVERWQRTNELKDFLNAYPIFDVSSYSIDDVDEMVMEWHQVAAGKGEGKMYAPPQPDLIIYGPQWQNKEWNGWTIQEVRSENDLQTEGNRMNHCVGSYCRGVEKGSVRIFSLRDSNNEPHVTIESSPDMSNFEQIMGNSNSEPDNTYKQMVKEWIMSLENPPNASENEGLLDNISRGRDDDAIAEANDILRGMFETDSRDEYGRIDNRTIDRYDISMLLEWAANRGRHDPHGNYFGEIAETPDVLVRAMFARKGAEGIGELEKTLQEIEEKEDFYDNWDWTPYRSSPEPEDFETNEEYEAAETAWEKQNDVDELEDMAESRRQQLPWGFVDDAWREINDLREAGKLNLDELRRSKVVAYGWYKNIK